MSKRVKQKILANVFLWLLWIVLGTLGVLPSFFLDSYIGQSHSIFRPLALILEIILYVLYSFCDRNSLLRYHRPNISQEVISIFYYDKVTIFVSKSDRQVKFPETA